MDLYINIGSIKKRVNLDIAFDLSRPITPGEHSSLAFYAPPIEIKPIQSGSFIGSVDYGSPVNTNIISLNPHGNTTHTETVAHISNIDRNINELSIPPFLSCYLHSAKLTSNDKDRFVDKNSLDGIELFGAQAIIIRSGIGAGPFSGTNPIYLTPELTAFVKELNIKHLLTDLPSVDKEEDGGALVAHKAFWDFPQSVRSDATITELLSFPDELSDGWYALNLQVMNLSNNASPSRPILYPLI